MISTEKLTNWFLTPWVSRLTIAVVTLAAFLPVLNAEILGLDDKRFVVDNESIHDLSISRAISFFTDPTTVSQGGKQWSGIYRPLRTLDFAIDWAIAKDTARFYHLKNLLYHILASLLALAVFNQLTRNRTAAVLGAMLFALHPVQVESVAWITSRGDLLLLVLFLLALLLHLKGRFLLACLALVAALLAKEMAVVFPGIVLVVDLFHRPGSWKAVLGSLRGRPVEGRAGEAKPRTGIRGVPTHLWWYAAYGVIVLGYYWLWRSMQPYAGHLSFWWGGSWAASAQMMLRAVVWYAKTLLLPINFVYDDHVPAVTTLDPGTILGVALVLAAGFGLWKGSPRLRMAIAWSLLAILPVSNLVFTVAIPTAERFLYLPSVGLAFAAGHLLVRIPHRAVSGALLLCFGALTFFRCIDWKNDDTLFAASWEVDVTPRGYLWQVSNALKHAWTAHAELTDGSDDPETAKRMRAEAERAVAAANDMIRYNTERMNVPPLGVAGVVRWKKANALLILGRDEEAYKAAKLAASRAETECFAHFNAGVAAERLGDRRAGGTVATLTYRDADSILSGALSGSAAPGLAGHLAEAAARATARRSQLRAAEYFEEAALELSTAHHKGYVTDDLRKRIATIYLRAGAILSEAASGEPDEERRGELLESAGYQFFYAGNAVQMLYLELRSREFLADAIEFHMAAGNTWLRAVELLDEFRVPAHLAKLLRGVGDCFKMAGEGQEMWGDPGEAWRSHDRAATRYENALRLATLGHASQEADLSRQGAAHCSFQAGRLAEGLGEIGEAIKRYKGSMNFLPSQEARAAIERLSR